MKYHFAIVLIVFSYCSYADVVCQRDDRPRDGALIEFSLSQQSKDKYKAEVKRTSVLLRRSGELKAKFLAENPNCTIDENIRIVTCMEVLAEELDCYFDENDKRLFTCL